VKPEFEECLLFDLVRHLALILEQRKTLVPVAGHKPKFVSNQGDAVWISGEECIEEGAPISSSLEEGLKMKYCRCLINRSAVENCFVSFAFRVLRKLLGLYFVKLLDLDLNQVSNPRT